MGRNPFRVDKSTELNATVMSLQMLFSVDERPEWVLIRWDDEISRASQNKNAVIK